MAFVNFFYQEFWDSCPGVIQEGMSEVGRFQQYGKKMQDMLYKSISVDQVDQFMAAKGLAEQNTLFEQLPMDKLREVQM